MRLIACVDDRGGMAFHQRRQSRDRVVRQHILTDASGGRLWMNAYSAGQFSPEEREGLLVAEDFWDRAERGDFCFVEDRSPLPWLTGWRRYGCIAGTGPTPPTSTSVCPWTARTGP